jgi:ATP-dependent protease ClpP protease subunit
MERDTFFSADEALKFGLLDEVIARRPAVAGGGKKSKGLWH